jgi:hypothetical protein
MILGGNSDKMIWKASAAYLNVLSQYIYEHKSG